MTRRKSPAAMTDLELDETFRQCAENEKLIDDSEDELGSGSQLESFYEYWQDLEDEIARRNALALGSNP